MRKQTRFLVYAAIIAALYAVLTHMQNLLLPGSANMSIQYRASEALCVLALFTPAAIPGLTVGCLIANLLAGATALDFIIGSIASCLAAIAMWISRRLTIKGCPLPAMLMPAVCNGVLIGWELVTFAGLPGGFWLNAAYVAIGEVAVLLTLGTGLFCAIKARRLDTRLFG